MERISSDDPQAVSRAAAVLGAQGVILYPTDTLYGLGVDAFSDQAVGKAYEIKARDPQKPMHCIVADLEMAERYAAVDDLARKLAKEFLPGPLTLILKKKAGIDAGIAKNIQTIGIRIPDNGFCIALARAFDKPYTTTSANLSGLVPERSVPSIMQQLGARGERISLAVDGGEAPMRAASTIVDISSSEIVILREGVIPGGKIKACVAL